MLIEAAFACAVHVPLINGFDTDAVWRLKYENQKHPDHIDGKVLIFGDSTSVGRLPDGYKRFYRREVTRGGLTCAGNYFLLKNAISRGAKPGAIVFLMHEGSWSRGVIAASSWFFDEGLLIPFGSLANAYDLTFIGRRPDLGLRMILKGMWPHQRFKYRYINFFIKIGLFTQFQKFNYRMNRKDFARMEKAEGTIDPTQMIYLRKMIECARDLEIPMVIGQTYYSSSAYRNLKPRIKQLHLIMKSLESEYPATVHVADFTENVYDDSYFRNDLLHFADAEIRRKCTSHVMESIAENLPEIFKTPETRERKV